MIEIEELSHFGQQLANASAEIIRKYFRTAIDINAKNDSSPVTVADRNAEQAMRELIKERYPSHGILGEEFGEENSDADYKWILDPIDGTVSFISGALSFGTLVALTHKGIPILGIFNQPVIGEMLVGVKDKTTLYSQGSKQIVKVRHCENLEEATLLTTDLKHIKVHQNLDKFIELATTVKYFRGWGDCYGYYLLVTGYVDIMVDPVMNLWDIAALLPIVQGAGGTISNYQGAEPWGANSIIAASPGIHKQVIEALN